jgi:hypothetical protein
MIFSVTSVFSVLLMLKSLLMNPASRRFRNFRKTEDVPHVDHSRQRVYTSRPLSAVAILHEGSEVR